MDRRTFLSGIGATVVGAAAARGRSPGGNGLVPSRAGTSSRQAHATSLPKLPVSSVILEENLRKGNGGWVIPRHSPNPSGIEGYADKVSAQRGETITIYVNTTARRFQADIFRMGYYQGFGARLVQQINNLPGQRQPAPVFTPGINLIECHWRASARFVVGDDWVAGQYLIKLIGDDGRQWRYIPFTVRDDESRAAIVVQSSVTTWQAYNLWGGYSLYGGTPLPNTSEYDSRSRVVSFDRPYGHPPLDADGSGDWLGNEFPFVFLVERHGLDVTYWTDVDLHLRPGLLANHRCLVSLGHDEYWSETMRYAGGETALGRGVNLVFLGANACYRHIRFERSEIGANRRVVCYKDASDPLANNPTFTTQNWAAGNDPRPESQLIGSMYRSYQPSAQRQPLVVVEPDSWIYTGTGLRRNERIGGVIGSEFDAYVPPPYGPGNVEILAHSPTPSVAGASFSDLTYYTRSGGGGVFATGTANWVTSLWDASKSLQRRLGFGVTRAREPLGRITLNVLAAFAAGPASSSHPTTGNEHAIYGNRASYRFRTTEP